MNILSVVNLPDALWQPLRERYPDAVARTELDPARLNDYLDWADVAFGNVPADWALRAPNLRWLQSVSAGLDAYAALANPSLRLTSARGVHHQPIAQHLALMMLALTRNLPGHLADQQQRRWNRQPDAITPVVGQQVGVIGYGGIGQQLAPLVRALGMRLVGVSRSVPATGVRDGVEVWPLSRLDELLQTSDHLVLCLPLTTDTVHFIDDEKLDRFKRGALFYNVSRGELVDEPALLRALQSGRLAGAALDVFQREPLPPDNPLWSQPNVIVTPHVAGHYRGLREATFRFFCQNLDRYRNGQPLLNEVTFHEQPQPIVP